MKKKKPEFVESMMRLEGQGYMPMNLTRKYEDLDRGNPFPLPYTETSPQLELKPPPL